ncbi:MAG: hypothetical protein FJ119_03885 [Deltaproteobacteria bacterium]|nr:hypothetical protein [Deltaproteobacteria bacterium]
MKKTLLLVCLIMLLTAGRAAAASMFQLSLTPDIALHDRDTRIEGMSLNIWGENEQSSFALGLVNGFKNQSEGAAIGLFNYSDGYTGFQFGLFMNYTNGSMLGWQVGICDYTVGTMQGVQIGGVNYAGNLKGLQLGLVNYAAAVASGIQIGIVNIIPTNEWFTRFPDQIAPAMFIFNWRF